MGGGDGPKIGFGIGIGPDGKPAIFVKHPSGHFVFPDDEDDDEDFFRAFFGNRFDRDYDDDEYDDEYDDEEDEHGLSYEEHAEKHDTMTKADAEEHFKKCAAAYEYFMARREH